MITAQTEYKFGAGRFIHEQNALRHIASESARLGRRAYVIGGVTAMTLTRERIAEGFGSYPYIEEVYSGFTSEAKCSNLQDSVQKNGCDVLIGVGGGRIMDLVKAAARGLNIPVITIPTIAATCAAYTPLSLFYHEDGKFDHCVWHDSEVNAVLADSDILANEPPRMLAAGILDAMAKYIEIPNGHSDLTLDNTQIDLHSAYIFSRYIYDVLKDKGLQAVRDIQEGRHSKTIDDVVFANIALTGIVSCLTRGKGQTSVAHSLYDMVRRHFYNEAKNYLHGEIVAIGLLAQLAYNSQTELIPDLRDFMRKLNMPCSLHEIGIAPTNENLKTLHESMRTGRYMVQDEEHYLRLWNALNVLKEGD